jgi:hypothetical protein
VVKINDLGNLPDAELTDMEAQIAAAEDRKAKCGAKCGASAPRRSGEGARFRHA